MLFDFISQLPLRNRIFALKARARFASTVGAFGESAERKANSFVVPTVPDRAKFSKYGMADQEYHVVHCGWRASICCLVVAA